jgi:hypothetical protein
MLRWLLPLGCAPLLVAQSDAVQKMMSDSAEAERLAKPSPITGLQVAIHGLSGLQAEGFVAMQLGGTPSATFWKITLEQVQKHALTSGLLTLLELDGYRALLDSREYRWMSVTMMSVWGQRTAP